MGESKVQGHIAGPTSYGLTSLPFHVNPFLEYGGFFFEICQCHSSKSHSESNILSTLIPFIPYQPTPPFLRYNYFKIWPWKSKANVIVRYGYVKNLTLEIQGQGQGCKVTLWVQSLINLHPFRLMFISSFFLEIQLHVFQTLNLKSQAQSYSSRSHKHSESYILSLSFPVYRPFHSWDTVISKFDFENTRSRSRLRSKFKVK